jgi:hypothetical protein
MLGSNLVHRNGLLLLAAAVVVAEEVSRCALVWSTANRLV